MNIKLAIPFLAVLAFAQGCIIVGPPGPNPGNITFSWTFYGQSCAAAGVANVHITIPGETLENSGVYPCQSNGYPGIVLHNFDGGSYTYSIEGLDSAGYTTYVASGDFTVDGDVLETVDLTPNGQPGSYALVTWTFPNNFTCATADTPAGSFLASGGVKYVDIAIDSDTAVRANCADGSISDSGQGVYSALTAPGTHTLTLTALSSTLYPLFSASGGLTTYAGNPVSDQVNLQWAVGGTVVSWALQGTIGSAQTCGGANNPYVYVNFRDSTNTAQYPAPGDSNTCTAAPTRYFYLPAAAGGTNYAVDMTAATATVTWSPVAAAPVVTVMPGTFPALTSATTVILRQN